MHLETDTKSRCSLPYSLHAWRQTPVALRAIFFHWLCHLADLTCQLVTGNAQTCVTPKRD